MTQSRTDSDDAGLVMVFGGTLDPVHNGHVYVLRDVVDSMAPSRVQVVLSARPPHRKAPSAAISHRLAMTNLAFSGEPGVAVDETEVARRGPSYTVWTLREMTQRFPAHRLALLVGADVLADLGSWYHGWEILSLCHLVVFSRPGYVTSVPDHMRHCLDQDPASLRGTSSGVIHLLKSAEHDISASGIRAGLAGEQREQVLSSGVLPADVADYIRQFELYSA